jgi:hypothetical protein
MSNGRVTPTRRYELGETSQKSGNRKAGGRLVWRCNNKLGSLRQSNSVWSVANWTGYAHLCLWYFGRGFSYARDLESLHAVCAVVESFHRAILSQPVPPSSIISNNLATADSVSRKEIVLTQRYCPGFRTRGFTIGQVRRGCTQSFR